MNFMGLELESLELESLELIGYDPQTGTFPSTVYANISPYRTDGRSRGTP